MEIILNGRLNLSNTDFVLSEPPMTLSVGGHSLTLPAGGSVALPVGVTGVDYDDDVSVTISGLASYETVTDTLDHTTFGGGKSGTVALTATEVNSGLTLNSSFSGGGRPVNTLTVTASDTSDGESITPAAQTISVTDPLETAKNDFNGDSISDLAFQNEASNGGANIGTPQIWLWNGTAVTSVTTLTNPGAAWHIVASADMNGDAKSDLIWQNGNGTPGIWLMNGATVTAEVGLTNPGADWHLIASGDFNGDGMSDLLFQESGGTLGVWLMNGATPIAESAVGNPGTNWKVVGTADYNGDGRDDILLQNSTTGNLMIDLMNGTTIASSVSINVGDPSWHAVSTGEFNGQAEIAWQNSDGTPAIWLMNGTSPVAEAALPNPGPAWQVVSIDHFAPTGQAGLLFQNTNGAMGLWQMNGTSIVAETGLLNPGSGWQSVNGHPFAAG
jgi:hypothetical protein